MSRYLFVVPPLVGHINPTLAVGSELARRGHDVAWVGDARVLHALGGTGLNIYDCATISLEERGDLVGPAALKFLWEHFFIPLGRAMEPDVTAAIQHFRPDAIIADQQALAGSLVAERAGITWITSATTSTELTDPLASMPKVKDWITGLIDELRDELGAPASGHDPRFSPHGILAFTTAELSGTPAIAAERCWMVGPALADDGASAARSDFPWDFLDNDQRNILISMGTVNGATGAAFLRNAAAAIGARPDRYRAVLVDPDGAVADPPSNVLVQKFVPQRALLPAMDAVICHAGHNTVCESLWNGLPLVTAPVRDDQPVVAQQVVDAGAGLRLRFRRATEQHIATALDTVLDPAAGHQAAAARIGQSFREAGGAVRAAEILAGLG
ncbi:glycosyltransferase [Lolliginicoccus suaedae]|uniref:glycosyltransferase n=1 Tax=Lolliginicoccus suaedae TaxID=2605429 RepID=UPI0011EBF317|nr:glycosyltransferase [Lolliginicoccus suaedae]